MDFNTEGNFSGPLAIELSGSEPVAFDVTIQMSSVKTLSPQVRVSIVELSATPTPAISVIMDLACEDENVSPSVDLSTHPHGEVINSVTGITSPGEVNCLLTFTPEAELLNVVAVEWIVRAALTWPGDTEIEVSIEVADAAE